MRECTTEYYNWTSHGEESVPEFEAATVSPMSEEPTPAAHVEANNHPQWGDEQHMDWAQRMVFYAAVPSYFSSSHDGVPDDGTRSCPLDTDRSGYYYGDGSYDYESGLADRFYNVVHGADQPLWNGCTQPCTQFQLGVAAELVDIKADDHILERIYDRISQWSNKILPRGHTLPGDYYNMKKFIKDLGLPVKKIGACKNACMFYWKDDIDLEYCKFYGDARYKPTRGQDPRRKKSPYVVLMYLPLTPRLQRLYSLRAIAEHMTWHATHQMEEVSMCHPSYAEA
ncbi:UNVERIFIED_CONTAM: hypothetical protein Slati_1724000 [Sesamum latifolium]|uniref:Uncharacterized protein n=1 Tax=Sesamum latifolium TaxID=2727402 RepID=A0AAW2X1D7_9LAMI